MSTISVDANNANAMINLLDFDKVKLIDFCQSYGEPVYRAQQLMQWIHQRGVDSFDMMTNISKTFRDTLKQVAQIRPPVIQSQHVASDGTCKWLLQVDSGNCIETVYIPEENRGTLCVSSQVGCALNCSFCATAKQGFNRNLTVAEIIGQVWLAVRQLSQREGHHDHMITNVVMMGMGEPLLNFDNVVSAMNIMMDDCAYGLSKYRVTLSTSGVIPEMKKLSQVSPVSLAVSLHAPNNPLRNQLVPINKKYPIESLMAVCRDYFCHEPKRKVTIEYVMLDGINDSTACARELSKLLQGVPSKVNLIPFNPFSGVHYRRSSDSVIKQFQMILQTAGIQTNIRKTRGEDIQAACGQLVGRVNVRERVIRRVA